MKAHQFQEKLGGLIHEALKSKDISLTEIIGSLEYMKHVFLGYAQECAQRDAFDLNLKLRAQRKK